MAETGQSYTCEGCGCALGVVEAVNWGVCLDCTRARARAVGSGGRCSCGPKRRRERVVKTAIRSWMACDRCLGTVRQLPDTPRRGQ